MQNCGGTTGIKMVASEYSVNLNSIDRLPKAVRHWAKFEARLQYEGSSLLRAYKRYRKGGGTIAGFVKAADIQDRKNCLKGGCQDPRFLRENANVE